MKKQVWCEHLDKSSKYTTVKYKCNQKTVVMRVQSWFCPECGVHGAESEIISHEDEKQQTAG